jgi:hypothetical protein
VVVWTEGRDVGLMMSLRRGRGVVFTIAAVVIFADGFAAVFADGFAAVFADGFAAVFADGFAAVFADGFAAVFADCLGIAEGSWLQSCLNAYRNPEL